MSRPSRRVVMAITAVATAVIGILVAPGSPGSTPDASGAPPPTPDRRVQATPPADHQVHIWSAEARDILVRAQRALGQEVIEEDQVRVLSADDVIAGLDSAGVERGFLLSNAYFFGVPHPTFLAQGDTALVRQIDQLNRAFVEVARELGFDRVVYGSDYPAIPMSRYLEGLRRDLPLTDGEFRDLVDDSAPHLP